MSTHFGETETAAWCPCGRTGLTGLPTPAGVLGTTSLRCQWCQEFVQSVPPSAEVSFDD